MSRVWQNTYRDPCFTARVAGGKKQTRCIKGSWRTVGEGPVLDCVRAAGVEAHRAWWIDCKRTAAWIVPLWAWVVYRHEVAKWFGDPSDMKEVYAGVTAELARLQKDPDARYAYLAMLVSAHQVVKDRWFVEAREALEGGWDDP